MSDLLAIMWLPFLACLVLATILGYLGMHVLSRGIIFVDLALAQFAALGASLGILLKMEPEDPRAYAVSLGFTFVGALVFSFSRMRERQIPQEALIGVSWAVASSAAILAVSHAPHGAAHLEDTLVGSILWVTPAQVGRAALVYALVGVFHWICRRRFFAITFDPDGAAARAVSVRWWDLLFYASFGFVVTSAVRIAGVLLVFTLLIVPSVVGALFARSVRGRLLLAWGFGWIVATLGCLASYKADLPTGAAVVCTFGAALLVALGVNRLWRPFGNATRGVSRASIGAKEGAP